MNCHLRVFGNSKPLTEQVVAYISEGWLREPSLRCIAQWASVQTYVIWLTAFGDNKNEYGSFKVPENPLFYGLEYERYRAENIAVISCLLSWANPAAFHRIAFTSSAAAT